MNVVTPTSCLARSTLGSAAMADLTRSEVASAIWCHVALRLGSDACDVKVDPSVVVKSARAFECNEVADTMERTHSSLRCVWEHAETLVQKHSVKPGLASALRESTSRPEYNPELGQLVVGQRKFKTKRGEQFTQLWEIFNPGHAVIQAFYDQLRESPSPSLNTETIYKCSAETLNETAVSRACDLFFQNLRSLKL